MIGLGMSVLASTGFAIRKEASISFLDACNIGK
jgi:hypothetical protein